MRLTTTGLMLAAALALPASMLPVSPATAQVSVGVSVGFGPPPLPVYAQPILPGPGYIWVPGYWAYGPYGYYWVPGAWVLPPAVGLLWTPGYWAWSAGYYRWYPGYWGPHVGFYGGINYGYGYYGRGYNGGYWRRGHFYYNRAVVRVDTRRIRYTYSKPVKYENRGPRVSYNGGKGGIMLRPTKQQQAWARERHRGPTTTQTKHRETAMKDPAMRYKNNRGKPAPIKPANRPPAQHQMRPSTPRPQPAVGMGRPVKPAKPTVMPKPRPVMPQQPVKRPVQPKPPKQNKPNKPPPHAAAPRPVHASPTQTPRQIRQPPKNMHRAAAPKSKQPDKKKKNNKHPGG